MSKVTKETLLIHRDRHNASNSYWIKDVTGVEVARVCPDCIDLIKARYDPSTFGEGERGARLK